MAGSVKVKGQRDLVRAFRSMEKDVAKETRKGLKDAAEPVRREAQARFSVHSIKSAAGFRVAVRTRGVAVEQRLSRTTGAHPEWGALQMETALIPARESKTDEVIDALEKVLDRLGDRNGF